MVSRVIPVDAFDLVLFGATGDLARRKILPGLFHRFAVGQMPEGARNIGTARSAMNRAEFTEAVHASLLEFAPQAAKRSALLEKFLASLEYVRVDAGGEDGWDTLAQAIRPDVVQAFYLSVSPALFGPSQPI